MGQKEKLIQRLKSKPKDLTFDDLETLLRYFDYLRSNKGKPAVHESYLFVKTVLLSSCTSLTRERNCWNTRSNRLLTYWKRRV